MFGEKHNKTVLFGEGRALPRCSWDALFVGCSLPGAHVCAHLAAHPHTREMQSVFTLILITVLCKEGAVISREQSNPLGCIGKEHFVFSASNNPGGEDAPRVQPLPSSYIRVCFHENQPLQCPVAFWADSRRLSYYWNDQLHSPLKIPLCSGMSMGPTLLHP